VDSLGIPIDESKRFDSGEDMGEQVYNDLNLQWGELNVIKD